VDELRGAAVEERRGASVEERRGASVTGSRVLVLGGLVGISSESGQSGNPATS
jgi:hypothetical protein